MNLTRCASFFIVAAVLPTFTVGTEHDANEPCQEGDCAVPDGTLTHSFIQKQAIFSKLDAEEKEKDETPMEALQEDAMEEEGFAKDINLMTEEEVAKETERSMAAKGILKGDEGSMAETVEEDEKAGKAEGRWYPGATTTWWPPGTTWSPPGTRRPYVPQSAGTTWQPPGTRRPHVYDVPQSVPQPPRMVTAPPGFGIHWAGFHYLADPACPSISGCTFMHGEYGQAMCTSLCQHKSGCVAASGDHAACNLYSQYQHRPCDSTSHESYGCKPGSWFSVKINTTATTTWWPPGTRRRYVPSWR